MSTYCVATAIYLEYYLILKRAINGWLSAYESIECRLIPETGQLGHLSKVTQSGRCGAEIHTRQSYSRTHALKHPVMPCSLVEEKKQWLRGARVESNEMNGLRGLAHIPHFTSVCLGVWRQEAWRGLRVYAQQELCRSVQLIKGAVPG